MATMPVRVDRTTSVWAAEIHDGQGWRRIHSRDPRAEGARQATETLAGHPSTVVLVGAGLGYLPEALIAADPTVRVVVLEPVSALAAAARDRRDWAGAIDAGRVEFRSWDARHEPGPLWQLFDRDEPEPVVVVQPALANTFPVLAGAMRESVSRSIFEGRANAEARRRQAGSYLLNTLGNLDAIAGSADAGALEGVLDGVPAVIVGAGPSLDGQIETLASVADDVAIIAVDTALRPLLNAGLQPPLAVALDPSDLNARHLLELPPHDDTWLVAEPSVAPVATREFASRLLTFRVADHHPWPWLASEGLARHLVRVWGSVLTAALDLAIHTGANPILFAGADLAFTGGRPYCRGATWERQWAELTGRGATMEGIWRSDLAARQPQPAADINGWPAQTTPHLVAFREWLLERMAEATGRRFINATGAGVLHGPSIAQGSLVDITGVLGARATLTARLRRLTDDAMARRAVVAAQLSAALDDLPADTRDAWAGFGRATMTLEDLDAATAHARRTLTTGAAALDRSAAELAGMLPAADRARRLRAALCGMAGASGPTVSAAALCDELYRICDALAEPDADASLSLDLGEDSGRVPVSLLYSGPTPLRRRIERFEDGLARSVAEHSQEHLDSVVLEFSASSESAIDASRLPRRAGLAILLAHEWLATLAAIVPSDESFDSPATIRWLLGQLIASAAERATDTAVCTTAVDACIGARRYPVDVDPDIFSRRITGLLGVASQASNDSASGISIRRGWTGASAPSLAVLDAPLLRIVPHLLRPESVDWSHRSAIESADGWTAQTSPGSHLVSIGGPGGISARLACYRPMTVAWSGHSLVVFTDEREVFSFPSLIDRVAKKER